TRRPFAAVAAIEDADGKGTRLLEPGTGKELRIRWGEIAQIEERASPMRAAPYLVLVLEDGRQVALADVGFAFAPSTVSTAPIPDWPGTRGARHGGRGAEPRGAGRGAAGPDHRAERPAHAGELRRRRRSRAPSRGRSGWPARAASVGSARRL